MTGAYPVDVRNSELYINIQVPSSVQSSLLSFRMYNTRGAEMISQSLATFTPGSTSWNRTEFNIYTIYVPSVSPVRIEALIGRTSNDCMASIYHDRPLPRLRVSIVTS